MAQALLYMTPTSSTNLVVPEIDPNEIRNGRAWRDVRAKIEEALKGYPAGILALELYQEARLFQSDLLPEVRIRRESAADAIARSPKWLKPRLSRAFDKNWA